MVKQKYSKQMLFQSKEIMRHIHIVNGWCVLHTRMYKHAYKAKSLKKICNNQEKALSFYNNHNFNHKLSLNQNFIYATFHFNPSQNL